MYKIFSAIVLTTVIWMAGCAGKPDAGKPAEADHSKMDHSKMDHSAMPSSPGAATAPYDLQFLDTMVSHHEAAVQMALQAQTKGQHSEITNLAREIVAGQNKEIGQMKEWRSGWFQQAPSAINMDMTGMRDSMKGMDMKKRDGLSGNAYDLEFIDQMIPHHEGALLMAKEALQRSGRSEIKTLANDIIKAQEAEIANMKRWREQWSAMAK